MKYKCIKDLSIPILDENWYEETGKYIIVKAGQIWIRDDETNNIGADVHLDYEDGNWIEISNETLKECFELVA